jgi:hypothetical protein
MPYDHKNTIPAGLAGHRMKAVLEDLNHRHFKKKCLVGSGGGSVGYVPCYSILFELAELFSAVQYSFLMHITGYLQSPLYLFMVCILSELFRLWLTWHELSVD